MPGRQVVLYFDEQEDALLFTLAASSVMSERGPSHDSTAAFEVAKGVCRASRIKAEGVLNVTGRETITT